MGKTRDAPQGQPDGKLARIARLEAPEKTCYLPRYLGTLISNIKIRYSVLEYLPYLDVCFNIVLT